MVIGRSDERNTPDDAKGALRHRMAVEGSFAETIWAAVMTPHRKAGHMIAPDQAPTLLQSALETRGPSTHAVMAAAPKAVRAGTSLHALALVSCSGTIVYRRHAHARGTHSRGAVAAPHPGGSDTS